MQTLSLDNARPVKGFEQTGAERYVADLQAKLAIGEGQMQPWAAFAGTLSANGRRMRDGDCSGDDPFGPLPDRLAALASMRQATEQLFATLTPGQQCTAARILPLCCLPPTVGLAAPSPVPNWGPARS
jgi:hypothetical protein